MGAGGPQSDIVTPEPGEAGPRRCGYLAECEQEYAAAMTEVLAMGQHERMQIAEVAQRRASAFSTERFFQDFIAVMQPLLPH